LLKNGVNFFNEKRLHENWTLTLSSLSRRHHWITLHELLLYANLHDLAKGREDQIESQKYYMIRISLK